MLFKQKRDRKELIIMEAQLRFYKTKRKKVSRELNKTQTNRKGKNFILTVRIRSNHCLVENKSHHQCYWQQNNRHNIEVNPYDSNQKCFSRKIDSHEARKCHQYVHKNRNFEGTNLTNCLLKKSRKQHLSCLKKIPFGCLSKWSKYRVFDRYLTLWPLQKHTLHRNRPWPSIVPCIWFVLGWSRMRSRTRSIWTSYRIC